MLIVLFGLFEPVMASHFRGGHIEWKPTGVANEVKIWLQRVDPQPQLRRWRDPQPQLTRLLHSLVWPSDLLQSLGWPSDLIHSLGWPGDLIHIPSVALVTWSTASVDPVTWCTASVDPVTWSTASVDLVTWSTLFISYAKEWTAPEKLCSSENNRDVSKNTILLNTSDHARVM